LLHFFGDAIRLVLRGDRLYWSWLLFLGVVAVLGLSQYSDQATRGLIVTGMSDQVSWGVYIANFTFLVGVAAAAVMLVIPAYIFHRGELKNVVLMGEGIAVAALIMCLLLVTVDLGRPDRMWHMVPFLGRFNLPTSMLAWDVVVLSGYLFLNLTIPFYILYTRYRGREPSLRVYFPGVLISIAWAISIHTVTAFLFSGNIGRPFWNTAILGPRFLASAFCSGPALMILGFQVLKRVTVLKVNPGVVETLALITTVAMQINLFLLGAEMFTDFYNQPEHNVSAVYLYFGLDGYNALVPWIWTAISFNVVAVVILTIHPLRQRRALLNLACVLTVVGVWTEKGMGLIVPGFVPTPIGEFFEYTPSAVEIYVTLGVWAVGLMVFTVLAKVAIPIAEGHLTRGRVTRFSHEGGL
jgi:molybdopterin-containing oxidoreductase family membrane subunit